MAPLVKEFQKHTKHFNTKVCVTAQHREMLDQVLEFFDITPDYDLDLMKPGSKFIWLTATIIESLNQFLKNLFQIMCLFMEILLRQWQDL